MSIAYLSLGSNLGERLTHLRAAIRRLDDHKSISVDAVSPIYASEAHNRNAADRLPDFLNLVVRVETELSPHDLLDICLTTETAGGRYRERGTWLPRTIDIDILVFSNHVLDSNRLQLPHPRMAERLFVLLPFHDLDSEAWVPDPFNTTISRLLATCTDSLSIERRYGSGAVYTDRGMKP